jgi:hypothetical protein
MKISDGAKSIFISPLSISAMIALRNKLIEFSGQHSEWLSNKQGQKALLPAVLELLRETMGTTRASGAMG